MRVLELFAGSRSIGKAAEALGHEVFSIDWEDYPGIDLTMDISYLKLTDLPWVPDMVWASPDCTTYTIAACSKHRTDSIIPKSEYAMKCDTTNKHWIGVIEDLLWVNPKMKYYIENPRGMLRKMPWMQAHPRRETVWYCQYGDDRAKPTDIWTNDMEWQPREQCHNFRNGVKHCHHQSAPRGSRTGTQGRKNAHERSKIPDELCTEIILSANGEQARDGVLF